MSSIATIYAHTSIEFRSLARPLITAITLTAALALGLLLIAPHSAALLHTFKAHPLAFGLGLPSLALISFLAFKCLKCCCQSKPRPTIPPALQAILNQHQLGACPIRESNNTFTLTIPKLFFHTNYRAIYPALAPYIKVSVDQELDGSFITVAHINATDHADTVLITLNKTPLNAVMQARPQGHSE